MNVNPFHFIPCQMREIYLVLKYFYYFEDLAYEQIQVTHSSEKLTAEKSVFRVIFAESYQ